MSELVSIVVLTHNKLPYTRRALESLLGGAPSDWELVVVDNGSDDGTPAWLESFSARAGSNGVRVTLVRNDGNVGCSTARNQGIEKARGDKLVFMDNDVALRTRSWLGRLGRLLDAERGLAMVGPKLVYPVAPHLIQCAGAAISATGKVQFRGRGCERDDPRFQNFERVQCLISACCMVKRSVLEQAGGFDEAFNPVEYEDFDLCYRIREAGYGIAYVPDVEMYHFESVTTAGTPSLPNTSLIIRHGLLFKRRWRHMFSEENGPPDEDTRWRRIPVYPLGSVGELPLVD